MGPNNIGGMKSHVPVSDIGLPAQTRQASGAGNSSLKINYGDQSKADRLMAALVKSKDIQARASDFIGKLMNKIANQ